MADGCWCSVELTLSRYLMVNKMIFCLCFFGLCYPQYDIDYNPGKFMFTIISTTKLVMNSFRPSNSVVKNSIKPPKPIDKNSFILPHPIIEFSCRPPNPIVKNSFKPPNQQTPTP